MRNKYQKILVVGNGGAGKSALSRRIGSALSLPVVHLDRLWWLNGWEHRTAEEFDSLLEAELKKSAWVMDGNYRRTFGHRLAYADLCIVLDIPSELCMQSVFDRAKEYEGKARPDMAEGCTEVVREDFTKWIRSYKKDVLPSMLAILHAKNVPYLVFTDGEQANGWLLSVSG